MYKTITEHNIPMVGKYNTLQLAVVYDTDDKTYYFRGNLMNIRYSNGLRYEEYELFSNWSSKRYFIRQVERRSKNRDKIAVDIAEKITTEMINYFTLYGEVQLAVKEG